MGEGFDINIFEVTHLASGPLQPPATTLLPHQLPGRLSHKNSSDEMTM